MFILSHSVYLYGIPVKFVYEGQWVIKVENPYSYNVKLRWP